MPSVSVRKNATYVVSSVLVQDGQLLLVQESKASCRNKWYLPAGRMEVNETIAASATREVKEESGFDFEMTEIFSITYHANPNKCWVRFLVTGNITGGSLKDFEDSESIQAAWIPLDSVSQLDLRGGEEVLVALRLYMQKLSFAFLPTPIAPSTTTIPRAQLKGFRKHRVVVLLVDNSNNVLVVSNGSQKTFHEKKISLKRGYSPSQVALKEIQKFLGNVKCTFEGITSLEHIGSSENKLDGLRFGVVMRLSDDPASVRIPDVTSWMSAQDVVDSIDDSMRTVAINFSAGLRMHIKEDSCRNDPILPLETPEEIQQRLYQNPLSYDAVTNGSRTLLSPSRLTSDSIPAVVDSQVSSSIENQRDVGSNLSKI
eukprot:GILK01005974.1.p1 GENE.GILK01005974.1~~GILK01005974.1.p1  ORF type:complete len:383 (+),score=55.70 GILK01005974.1:37-1149(+)